MTVDDPVYKVTVSNESAGWSYDMTQGDEYDPDVLVQLADSLTMTWGFKDDSFFRSLDVETVTLSLYISEAADMSDVQEGHIITVDLDRPTGAGHPYMHFAGRITDITADTHPLFGTIVQLIATDPTSEFSGQVAANDTVDPLIHYALGNAINRYFASGAFRYRAGDFPVSTQGHSSEMSLAEYVDKVCQGSMLPGEGGANLRYAYDWTPGVGWSNLVTWTDPDAVPPSPWLFYPQGRSGRLTETFAPPFTYAYDPADGDRVTAEYDPAAIGDPVLTVLDGSFVLAPLKWIKDRKQSPNNIVATGWDPFASAERTDQVRNQESIDAYGVITLELDTIVELDDVFGETLLPDAVLEYVPPPGRWGAKEVTVIPELVADDATLDTIATQFYPHSQPVESVLGRPVIVTNIDPRIKIQGDFIYGVIVGCTFSVSAGKLRITPKIQPIAVLVDDGVTPGPTYDEFGASGFGNATYHDQGGSTDYIDPELTYDQAKLTGL